MKEICSKHFKNGSVYALYTEDRYPIETTDTFLPFYTKDAVGRHQNKLDDNEIGDRTERWMIGISCMSGCPVGCKFCATGQLKKIKLLTSEEMVGQVDFVLAKNPDCDPANAKEFKINVTRMGDGFLNIKELRKAVNILIARFPNIHIFISTIGIKGSDFNWIKDNVTLQISLHSLDENRRDELIPYGRKMSIAELGAIRTQSHLKTTVNMTLVDYADFDIETLRRYFDPEFFFIKLSPINVNAISEKNHMGTGVVDGINLV